ncbi:type II toxin-antitoxin system RelE/ParE family toxin [Olsenella uli]|uniref:type II toxin-antitoxin system RelE/ParE family toxin n=1 Tax=Olsenella uli TaxID=133926 RepID=UPI0028D39D25|nr:type II toxin-antitoxin system RelE/ParE family toxin [Olsenella uli]
MWQVDFTLVADWIATLDDETVAAIVAATDVLERQGPALGRPLVDAITGSRLKNMKELRPASPDDSEIRILFAFDPVRMGILLVGGDKASGKGKKEKWSGWYKKAVPEAERLYDEHLRGLEGGKHADR